MSEARHFGPELFEFLLDLRANNNREWFKANQGRYERHVKEPLLRFIEDFGLPLRDISGHFVADPRANGGSMFRIYRDVRFSRDKSPYKTQAAAQFRHEAGKTAHAPGFYLHLAPGEVGAGVGVWRPAMPALTRIRNAIVENPEDWRGASKDPAFLDLFSVVGDSLKRAPKGFDPGHRDIEDLRRKDHIAWVDFDEEDATSPGFLEEFAFVCRRSIPYMRFLTAALGLPF